MERLLAIEAQADQLTPKQRSRLRAFSHIVERVIETQNHVNRDEKMNYGKVEGGKVVDVYFPLDQRFVNIWTERAFSMYSDELIQDERTKTCANFLLDHHLDRLDPVMSVEEAITLWERE